VDEKHLTVTTNIRKLTRIEYRRWDFPISLRYIRINFFPRLVLKKEKLKSMNFALFNKKYRRWDFPTSLRYFGINFSPNIAHKKREA
jgi:hypothetical protein